MALNIKGIVDGNVVISSALKDPLIQSDIILTGFRYSAATTGMFGTIAVEFMRKVADLSARNNLNGKRILMYRNLRSGSKQFRIDALHQIAGG
jgi:hypothetical protein